MRDVFVIRAEVVGVAPGLDDVVVLQRVQRRHRPIVAAEHDVGVDPGDVLRLRRAVDADVQQVFLVPDTGFRADRDVADAIHGAGVVFLAERAFDDGQTDAGIQHAAGEAEPVAVGGAPAQRVGAGGEDVELGGFEHRSWPCLILVCSNQD